jgi:hypothetical protein
VTITAPLYTSAPYTCTNEVATYALRTQPDAAPPSGWISFNADTRVITINTSTNANAGTYNLAIKVTRDQSSITSTMNFVLVLANPCTTTTITTT